MFFWKNDDFQPNILETAHCVSFLVTKYDCNLASKQMLTRSCSAVTAHIVPPLPHRKLLLRCQQESEASWRSIHQKLVRTINFGLKNFSTHKNSLMKHKILCLTVKEPEFFCSYDVISSAVNLIFHLIVLVL